MMLLKGMVTRKMTNTELLVKKINESGLKVSFIAEKLGLTYQGFMNKVNNKTEFKATEVAALQQLLHLTNEEVQEIFFSADVE